MPLKKKKKMDHKKKKNGSRHKILGGLKVKIDQQHSIINMNRREMEGGG